MEQASQYRLAAFAPSMATAANFVAVSSARLLRYDSPTSTQIAALPV